MTDIQNKVEEIISLITNAPIIEFKTVLHLSKETYDELVKRYVKLLSEGE